MRRSELAGAERNLVCLGEATLTVEDTRIVVDGKAEDSDGKTDSSFSRTVSLDPVTVAYLRLHLAMLDQERKDFGTAYEDHGKLFCHPDGRLIHRTRSPGDSTDWSTQQACPESGCTTSVTRTPHWRSTTALTSRLSVTDWATRT